MLVSGSRGAGSPGLLPKASLAWTLLESAESSSLAETCSDLRLLLLPEVKNLVPTLAVILFRQCSHPIFVGGYMGGIPVAALPSRWQLDSLKTDVQIVDLRRPRKNAAIELDLQIGWPVSRRWVGATKWHPNNK